jgi:hypothetical protein
MRMLSKPHLLAFCGVFLSGTSTRRATVPLEDATTGSTTPKMVMAC